MLFNIMIPQNSSYSPRIRSILVLLILFALIPQASAADCLSIVPNCRICNDFQCFECLSGYKLNTSGTCTAKSSSYTTLIIVASVLLGIMFLLACGWIIYGQIIRCKRRDQLEIIRQQLQGFYVVEMNYGMPPEIQAPPTNRVMLPSAPTLSFLNTETCTICLDGNIQIRSNCQHYFHLCCILQWTTKSLSCPNCRQRVPLFMILCQRCNSFNEIVELCGPRCRQSNHQQCFYKINNSLVVCKQCKN